MVQVQTCFESHSELRERIKTVLKDVDLLIYYVLTIYVEFYNFFCVNNSWIDSYSWLFK